ncbi:MAG: hypothetical protein QXL01_04365 [Thermoplasmatales archaeon]
MYYCVFVKIENNHNRLRDDIITGMCPYLPRVGESFFMYVDPHTDTPAGAQRYVNTSPVLEVKKIDEGYLFKTKNGSTYLLKDVERAIP